MDRTTVVGSVAGAPPPTERPPRCPETGHTKSRGYVTAKFGVQLSAAGSRQKYRCTTPDCTLHYFMGSATRSGGSKPRAVLNKKHHRRKHDVSCPQRAHARHRVRFRGTRTNADGSAWEKFQCVPTVGKGKSHYFSVLRSVTGSAITTLDRRPDCREHELSTVVRYGPTGRKGTVRKQRYRCTPADGSGIHYFTTPLPREEVHAGVEACSVCDELLSPHRGALGGARRTPWTLKNLAQALNDLSTGSSYATVSMEMRQRRDAAQPGQAGTLLGAIHELIAPRDPGVKPVFAATRALRWWAIVRPVAAAGQPCGDSNEEACPSCRAGQPCPRDVLYQAIAEMAVLGMDKELTRKRIDDSLVGKNKFRKMNKWAIHFTARGRRPHYCWESAAASTTTGGALPPVPCA